MAQYNSIAEDFIKQVCPSCSISNDGDANFCQDCGAVLKPILICENCKAENDDQAKYCDQCGKELETSEFLAKQRRKLLFGLILIVIFLVFVVFVAVSNIKKGKYRFSTKDSRFWEEVKELEMNRNYKQSNREDTISTLSFKYGVEIRYKIDSNFFTEDWPADSKAIMIDEKELERFSYIIGSALQKYPVGLIKKNLKGIFLCKKIISYGIEYGASHSSDNNIIYLCSEGKNNGYTDVYLIDSFHHEFSHILFDQYRFPINEWKLCNSKKFQYTYVEDGGYNAMLHEKDSIYGTVELYEQGFLSEYSKSAIEEDFAVFSGMILTEPKEFESLVKRYSRIKRKFKVWLSFYNSIDKRFTEEYVFGEISN